MNPIIFDIRFSAEACPKRPALELYTPRQVTLPEACPSCGADLTDQEAANLAISSRPDGADARGHITHQAVVTTALEPLTPRCVEHVRPIHFACARCDHVLAAANLASLVDPVTALSTLLEIRDVIWPRAAPDAPWHGHLISAIAEILTGIGLNPLQLSPAAAQATALVES